MIVRMATMWPTSSLRVTMNERVIAEMRGEICAARKGGASRRARRGGAVCSVCAAGLQILDGLHVREQRADGEDVAHVVDEDGRDVEVGPLGGLRQGGVSSSSSSSSAAAPPPLFFIIIIHYVVAPAAGTRCGRGA